MNSLLFVFLYMVFAVLMPVAETPEDRLRMKGKEVNPQNLAEEVAPAQPSQKKEEVPGHKGPAGCIGCIGGFFVALWTVITTLFRWCIYIAGAFVAVMCIVGIVSLLAIALNPSGWMEKSDLLSSPELAAVVPDLTVPFYIFVLAALLVLSITAYAIIHSLLNEFKQMPSMPYRQRIALLVMWILGLVAAGAALGYGLPRFIDADNAYNKRAWGEINARYREEHTHDGIFIEPREWEWLQDNGWRILSAEGCNDRFTAVGEYYVEKCATSTATMDTTASAIVQSAQRPCRQALTASPVQPAPMGQEPASMPLWAMRSRSLWRSQPQAIRVATSF